VSKKKDLSKEDKKTWETYIKNPSDLFDKEKNLFQDKKKKERFKYDLHGYSLDEANQKVKEIIVSCANKNYREILLITGKGLHSTSDRDSYVSKEFSKLKYSVPDFIQNNNELKRLIVSISDADRIDGGEGAILIRLKNL
jgi:DNA-nicking Smr family endonuclease